MPVNPVASLDVCGQWRVIYAEASPNKETYMQFHDVKLHLYNSGFPRTIKTSQCYNVREEVWLWDMKSYFDTRWNYFPLSMK